MEICVTGNRITRGLYVDRDLGTKIRKSEIRVVTKEDFGLIFCVEFRDLSHLTWDLSQAEKKITVVTS